MHWTKESALTAARAATAVQEDALVELGTRNIEKRRTENKDVIEREASSAVKTLVTNQLSPVIEESLDDILKTSFHNAQSSIRSIVYKVVEQVVLYLLRKDGFEGTLQAQSVKLVDTVAAAEGFSKR